MSYVVNIIEDTPTSIQLVDLSIPFNPANRHYQEVLDAIIEQGADCFDGDIPTDLQAAADAKLASGAYNANKV